MFGFGLLTLIFRGMLFITGQSNLNFRQFQDGTTQSGIHPAPDSLFIGVRVSYLHGVLDSYLHDLWNNSRHHFSWRSSIQKCVLRTETAAKWPLYYILAVLF